MLEVEVYAKEQMKATGPGRWIQKRETIGQSLGTEASTLKDSERLGIGVDRFKNLRH
jgi:hypothetical protein